MNSRSAPTGTGRPTPAPRRPSPPRRTAVAEIRVRPSIRAGPNWFRRTSRTATIIMLITFARTIRRPVRRRVISRPVTANRLYRCPVWVAAPLHDCYTGDVKRTDAYRNDPDINCTQAGHWSGYARGHMLGSNERRVTKNVNRDVFYYSNIGPAASDLFQYQRRSVEYG